MPTDITFKVVAENTPYRFNYRVAAIITANDKILIHKFTDADYAFLPGGRVQLGETAQEAIRRELQEELGIATQPTGMPFVAENFFRYGGETFHEISFFFKIDGRELDLPEHNEIRGRIHYMWHRGDDLVGLNLQPEFLNDVLLDCPDNTTHIVNRMKNKG